MPHSSPAAPSTATVLPKYGLSDVTLSPMIEHDVLATRALTFSAFAGSAKPSDPATHAETNTPTDDCFIAASVRSNDGFVNSFR